MTFQSKKGWWLQLQVRAVAGLLVRFTRRCPDPSSRLLRVLVLLPWGVFRVLYPEFLYICSLVQDKGARSNCLEEHVVCSLHYFRFCSTNQAEKKAKVRPDRGSISAVRAL